MLATALRHGLSACRTAVSGDANIFTIVKPVKCCIEGYASFAADELLCCYFMHAKLHASLVISRIFACTACITKLLLKNFWFQCTIEVTLLVPLTSAASCRACTAASAAQSNLQGAVDGDLEDLSVRISRAEAAVKEAESSAQRAIELEHEAARAAARAHSHYEVAAAHHCASDTNCCGIHAV